MVLHRAQILLDAEQHRQLERRARESGRSISELVRGIVDDYLTRESNDEAMRCSLTALEGLAAIRRQIEQEQGVLEPVALQELMDAMREERDTEISPW